MSLYKDMHDLYASGIVGEAAIAKPVHGLKP